jgi:repressor LexA
MSVDSIPFPSKLLRFPSTEAFIVEAKGDGMNPVIKSGDIIVAQKQSEAENGQIIVCMYNGTRMIKIFYKSVCGTISLCNQTRVPVIIESADTFVIEGIVRNIFSYIN